MNNLQRFKEEKKNNLTILEQQLLNYNKEYFNIFIIYFGDCNFNYFNKDKYQINTIKLFGRIFKLRIFVFYVSKQAMVETFKTINKVANIEYINDILIQFYEIRREKPKRKRRKKEFILKKDKNPKPFNFIYKIVFGTVMLLVVGLTGRLIYTKFVK